MSGEEKVDWFNATAVRVHGRPVEWRWCKLSYDAPEGFCLVVGAVPVGVWSSGKKKGRPKWPKMSECETIWMKRIDMLETMRLWESETGKCSKCQGACQTLKIARANGDHTYIPCVDCNGTGLSIEKAVAS